MCCNCLFTSQPPLLDWEHLEASVAQPLTNIRCLVNIYSSFGFLMVKAGPGLMLELLWSFCCYCHHKLGPPNQRTPRLCQIRGGQRQRGRKLRGITQVTRPIGGKAGQDSGFQTPSPEVSPLATSPPAFSPLPLFNTPLGMSRSVC